MKQLDQIISFSDWDEELEKDSLHDQYALYLENIGHKVICMGRSIVTIEQCEALEESPIENTDDPLKITVHADKDISPTEEPHEIFISANRFGVGEVILKMGEKTFKANWIEN